MQEEALSNVAIALCSHLDQNQHQLPFLTSPQKEEHLPSNIVHYANKIFLVTKEKYSASASTTTTLNVYVVRRV